MGEIIRLSGSETLPIKLDLKDKKIMAILIDDARVSFTQLAKKVGLKRETVDYRVKKLMEQKFITGFAPIINFKLLGYSFFEFFILLNEAGEKKKEFIIKKLADIPNTSGVLEYNDRWDIKQTIIARSMEEFDSINEKFQLEYGKYISDKDRSALLKSYSKSSLSNLFLPEYENPKNSNFKKNSEVKFDDKDIAILKYLSENCRQSTYLISDKVKLSPDGVGIRIKKMVENGIIEKFTTFFDNSKLSLYWYTFSVQLRNFDIEATDVQILMGHADLKTTIKYKRDSSTGLDDTVFNPEDL